ncbi:MAG: glycerophosphodiester phosphodiesterase [Parasporobacterium sp.]|nr:glycerophosphodiester phosphodiesterase [Parasporobacterium sp.]
MRKRLFDKSFFWHVNFAHRGLHDLSKGIPENSLAAFRAAAEAGYGAELDVQLSKDDKVVVFHDDDLKRVCGINGTIADYTYEELSKMSLCGTKETIPLFSDVLDIFKEKGGPLLVELKTGKRNVELCEKTYALLKTYPGVYCIESFNPFIVNWFRKNAPEIFRGQLAEGPGGYRGVVPRFVAHMLSYCRLSFLNKPDFIAYELGKRPKRILRMKEKGRMLFAWTSRSPETDQNENDAIIFEHYLPPLKY